MEASETALPVATRAVNVILSQLDAILSELKRLSPPRTEGLDANALAAIIELSSTMGSEHQATRRTINALREKAILEAMDRRLPRAISGSSGEESGPSIQD